MKKLLMLLLVAVMCFGYTACGSNKEPNQSADSSNKEPEQSEKITKGRNYYFIVEIAADVMKSELKNPASLEIKNIIVSANKEFTSKNEIEKDIRLGLNSKIDVFIEYSAKNGFGNEKEGYAFFSGGKIIWDQDDLYNGNYKTAHGRNSDYYKETSEGYYKSKKSGSICFEMDLEDYIEQGYLLP